MSTTALDVIKAALRKLRVLPSGGTPTAAETADCLDALNDMLSSWAISGIDLAPVTLASGDSIDVPDDHLEALKANLALRIADDFGAQITPTLVAQAAQSHSALLGYHFSATDLSDDNPLARCNIANSLSG